MVGQTHKVLSAVDLKLIKSNLKKSLLFIGIQRIKMEREKYLMHVTWAEEATFKTNK